MLNEREKNFRFVTNEIRKKEEYSTCDSYILSVAQQPMVKKSNVQKSKKKTTTLMTT